MKTSNRFDNAIQKLYTAFHNNTLNPEDCKQCAVGNILDHKDSWKHLTDIHGSVRLNYVGLVNQNLGRKFNGFSPLELLQIEAAFLKACGYHLNHKSLHKPEKPMTKDILFKGLSEVVSKLCELDGLSDVMDCSSLFHYRKTIRDQEFAL